MKFCQNDDYVHQFDIPRTGVPGRGPWDVGPADTLFITLCSTSWSWSLFITSNIMIICSTGQQTLSDPGRRESWFISWFFCCTKQEGGGGESGVVVFSLQTCMTCPPLPSDPPAVWRPGNRSGLGLMYAIKPTVLPHTRYWCLTDCRVPGRPEGLNKIPDDTIE